MLGMLFFLHLARLRTGCGTNIGIGTVLQSDFEGTPFSEVDLFTFEIEVYIQSLVSEWIPRFIEFLIFLNIVGKALQSVLLLVFPANHCYSICG